MYTGTILSVAMPNHMIDRSTYDRKNKGIIHSANEKNAAKFLRAYLLSHLAFSTR
jgi:hypothetical protein